MRPKAYSLELGFEIGLELIVRDMQGDTITQVGVELDPAPEHAWYSWFQRLRRLLE